MVIYSFFILVNKYWP